nr:MULTISPECIES: iron-containing alcohol dehydrogenase [unclassified Citrobacter]
MPLRLIPVNKKNPISDALAREALRLISRHLVTACRDGNNREAREMFCWARCWQARLLPIPQWPQCMRWLIPLAHDTIFHMGCRMR